MVTDCECVCYCSLLTGYALRRYDDTSRRNTDLRAASRGVLMDDGG